MDTKKAPTTKDIIKAVRNMRSRQKQRDLRPSGSTIEAARQAERAVDLLLEKMSGEETQIATQQVLIGG